MNKIEFAEITSMLDIVYNKLELDQSKTAIWYDFFKEYKKQHYLRGVKDYILNETYSPLPASLKKYVDEAESSYNLSIKNDIIKLMYEDNYFKTDLELSKANNWIETGIIPDWFREDMKKYYSGLLESKENLKLEG